MAEKITIIEADGNQRELELDLDEITIGRAEDNIIQITEKRSSRQHLRFEATADGYVVHDLGTSNGTRVNGMKVEGSMPFKVGDKVQIGECTIQIGDPLPEPVAAPVADAGNGLPKTEVKDVKKVEAKKDKKKRASNAPSSVTPPMTAKEQAQVKKMKAMAPLFAIPLAAAIVVRIGWNGYDGSIKAGELNNAHAKVSSTIETAYAVSDMQGAIDEIDAFMRKVSEYDMDEKFGKKIAALSAKRKELAGTVALLRNADKEFDILQTRRKAGMEDQEYYERLLSLKKVFADTPVVEDINTAIDDVRLALRGKLQKRVDGVRSEVTQLVSAQKYRMALNRIDDFQRVLTEGELKEDEMAKGFLFKLDPMRKMALQAMKLDLQNIESQFEVAISRQQWEGARELLADALDRFKGTPYVYQLKRDIAAIHILRKVAASGGSTGGATGTDGKPAKKMDLAEARRAADEMARYIKVYERAKELCRKGEYDKAMDELRRVAKKGGKLGEEFSRYLQDVESFLALKADLITQINGKQLKDAKWKMGSRDWIIEKADEKRITLRMAEGQGTTAATFRQIGYRGLFGMFQKMTLETVQWQTIGIFCWYHDMESETHFSLIKGIKSSTEADVYNLWSRLSGIPQPDDGFVVFMRRIMTKRAKQMAKAEAEANRLVAKLGSGGKAADDAFQKFQQLMDESGKKYGELFAKKMKKNVVDRLKKKRKQNLAQLENGAGLGTIEQLDNLSDELDKRRAHALKLIFDVKAYPYDACHGCKAQPEVDVRVNAVKVIWNDPFNSGVIPGSVSGTVDKIKQINDQLAKLGETAGSTGEIDLDHVKAVANKKLDIKTYGGNGQKGTVAYNEKVMKENEEKESVATSSEKKQVEVTNDYRIMMGRKALKIDDSLTLAARGHSQYMQSTGKWGHVIPGHPNGDTPGARAAKEGYSAGTGENIFKGSSSPNDAFKAWYNSSGHHRNMLNPNWKSMGAGHDGKHWTQLFGAK